MDTSKENQPLIVFNSLPWEREEWLQVKGDWTRVTVPSMGHQTVDVAEVQMTEFNARSAENNTIQNELIRVEFDSDGSIRSVFDKELGKEIIASGRRANVLSVYHDDGDAWDFPSLSRSDMRSGTA